MLLSNIEKKQINTPTRKQAKHCKTCKTPCDKNSGVEEVKPWFIWNRITLNFIDRLRLLLGWKLYIRFDSPDGNCHAGCDLSHQITQADYEHIVWPQRALNQCTLTISKVKWGEKAP